MFTAHRHWENRRRPMEWKVIAALGMLGLAIVAGLVITIVTSVNRYAKQLTDEKEDPRRGFEVKAGESSPLASDKTLNAEIADGVERDRT